MSTCLVAAVGPIESTAASKPREGPPFAHRVESSHENVVHVQQLIDELSLRCVVRVMTSAVRWTVFGPVRRNGHSRLNKKVIPNGRHGKGAVG